MTMKPSSAIAAAILCIAATSCTRTQDADTARQRIDSLLQNIPARVGLYAESDDGRTIAVRADEAFPMLSTFKVPVAVAVMQHMEAAHTPLSQETDIAPYRMLPDTYSPMRERHPHGWCGATIDSLLAYAVSLSDNNACDILIGCAGGIGSVARSMEEAEIGPMTIAATEEDMHISIGNQRINVCTPRAAAQLLKRLAKGELLSEAGTETLIGYMSATETGPDKLRAGLPPHACLAHKTGSSDRTPQGVKIADNDMGIVTLADGSSYRIAVFVADSELDDSGNAALIAAISKIVYEAFSARREDR